MMNMTTHPEHLLARAADGGTLTPADQRDLNAHLEACASCRGELDAQRVVARTLQARAAAAPSSGFSARVAARLDAEESGFLDIANWRAWTAGLVPVAAALVLAAYLGVGSTSATVSTTSETPTFDTWASASAGETPAAVFLQPASTGDQLLETVLTGAVPATTGEPSNVR